MARELPNPEEGSTGQIPKIQSDGSWGLGNDQQSSAGTTSIAEDLGTNGRVVWIGANSNGAVDPSGTSTPIQDAINSLESLSNDFGIIYLPAGTISEGGPLDDIMGKVIVGQGTGRGVNGQHGTTVEIQSGNGIEISSQNEASWCYLDQFTLKASNTNDNRSAVVIDNPSTASRHFNMGTMGFHSWTDIDGGIIRWETRGGFSSHWNQIIMQNCRGSGLRFDGGSPLALSIGNYWYEGRAGNAGPNSDGTEGAQLEINSIDPKIDIQYMNNSGHTNRTLWFHPDAPNSTVRIGSMNHEPTEHPSGVTDTPFFLGGSGSVQIGYASITLIEVPYMVELAVNNENKIIHRLHNNTGTIQNTKVNVSSEPSGESWYFGPSSDIDNTAGSTTGNIRCMDTAGTGVA